MWHKYLFIESYKDSFSNRLTKYKEKRQLVSPVNLIHAFRIICECPREFQN